MKRIQHNKEDKLGNLTYLEDILEKSRDRKAKFQCECGNVFTATIHNVVSGATSSCGCKKKKVGERRFIHGMSGTSIYNTYLHILKRCYNVDDKAYHNYGGRGITVCNEWKESFVNFYNDMGNPPSKKHTIERKNNSKGYSKENCIWATRAEQNRNKRTNRIITINGESKCLVEWAEHFGINKSTVWMRLKSGISIEKALS